MDRQGLETVEYDRRPLPRFAVLSVSVRGRAVPCASGCAEVPPNPNRSHVAYSRVGNSLRCVELFGVLLGAAFLGTLCFLKYQMSKDRGSRKTVEVSRESALGSVARHSLAPSFAVAKPRARSAPRLKKAE